jgi:hypothetical protein
MQEGLFVLSAVGAPDWLTALYWTWFARHFAAALAAVIPILQLCSGHQPQTTA